MPVSPRTISTYLDRQELYERLRVEGLRELEGALHTLGNRVYKIAGRVKTPESFVLKAEKRQTKYPLSELTDLVGLRVVCLFRSDLEIASETIRNAFIVLNEEDKSSMRTDDSVFNYEDIQFVVRLRRHLLTDAELAPLRFEIQLRTLATDTWATISHEVAYKEEPPLPPDLRHELYATNAMLWVADRTFDSAHRYREQTVFAGQAPHTEGDVLNAASLVAYIEDRFPDRRPVSGGLRHDSTLLAGLIVAGARTVGDVRVLIDKGMAKVAQKLKASDDRRLQGNPAAAAPMPAWWVVTEALRAASPLYAKYLAVSTKRAQIEVRAAALSRMPFAPTVYAQLVERLAERLEKESCDAVSLTMTREILAEMNADVPSAVLWLESLGGYCDCEVLMNVDAVVGDFDEP